MLGCYCSVALGRREVRMKEPVFLGTVEIPYHTTLYHTNIPCMCILCMYVYIYIYVYLYDCSI